MKRKALVITIAIASMLVVTPQGESKDKDAGKVQQTPTATNVGPPIPWPFTINQNGYKIIKGKWIQYGQAVPPGTTVTFEGRDKEDAGHHFVAQLVAERWTITDLPSRKGMLWEKLATKGPYEAIIASEQITTAAAPKPQTNSPGAAKTITEFKLWRTRLELKRSKNATSTEPPPNEMILPPG